MTEKDIQPFFDLYSKRTVPTKRRINGKIAAFLPLLRFPGTMFDSYLNPEETIRVTLGMPTLQDRQSQIKTYRFGSFVQAGDPYLKVLYNKAEDLLARYSEHPVFGHPYFKEKLFADMRYAVGVINGVVRLFEEEPIAAVLLGATNEAVGRALAIYAARRRIPSIATQHGMIGREEGFLPVFASRLAVHGYHEQEWYYSKGLGKRDVYITGHPRFDIMLTTSPREKNGVLRQAGVDPHKKTVLVATNQIRDMQAWNAYIESLMKYPNVNVLIKPHRNEIKNEKLEGYTNLARKYNRVKLLTTNDIKMPDLLHAADAVAVELSTVGLEAMICGVPVVFLRKDDYSDINHRYYFGKMAPFVETDGSRLAKLTYAVLTSSSTRARNLEQVKNFMEHAYPVRLAGEAVSRIISRLTGKMIRNREARLHEGRLVKGSTSEIYYVRGGVKRHILNSQAMVSGKFDPKAVHKLDDDVLKKIPPGIILR